MTPDDLASQIMTEAARGLTPEEIGPMIISTIRAAMGYAATEERRACAAIARQAGSANRELVAEQPDSVNRPFWLGAAQQAEVIASRIDKRKFDE